VDIEPDRVKEARAAVKEAGVEKKCTIVQDNVMDIDFSSATVVTMYLLPSYNRALAPRLEKFLPVGARVVSHDFDNMPDNWQKVIAKTFKDKNGYSHYLYLWKITPEMKKAAKDTKKDDAPKSSGEMWTCPMHPEIKSPTPGKCPKCGMNLVRAKK
jgi:hypothetical protein